MKDKKVGKSAMKGRKRAFRLNSIAQLFGFPTWRKMESAFISLEILREKADENVVFLKNNLKGLLQEMMDSLEMEE
jgi:hypothetical protein